MSKSNIRAMIAGLAVLGCAAAVTVGTPRAAVAQAADANADKPISINMQNTPISAVLKVLFNSVGANYSIDSDVQGNVNITMNNVGFLAALRSILHATNPPLTYDYTDGVYHIRVKKQEVVQPQNGQPVADNGNPSNPTGEGTTTASSSPARYFKLPVDHYDVLEMAKLVASSQTNGLTEIVPSAMGASGQQGSGMGGGVGMAGSVGGVGMGGMSGGMGGGMGMSGGMGMGGMGGGYR